MITLIKVEVLRILRNKRFLFFTLLYPVVMYLMFVSIWGNNAPAPGLSAKTYFMVSMATFGTVGAALSTAMRISLERKSGWTRQLRLTALPGWGYVTAKILASSAATLLAILAVFAAGIAEGVSLSATEWIGLVAAIWIGSFVFSALGVALGYSAAPDSVQPVMMVCYMLMAVLGGTWFPLTGTMQSIGQYTPVGLYNQLGKVIETGSTAQLSQVVGLAGYLVAFAALAAWLYQRDRKAA
ncbi:ABC transporter permease [Streptacidiphilus sp. EB129]|uniref:ABC transporter permease n=1 Tax=Streptacidiphilus sp. EB129 TaxID=3156262 RepID=UPI003513C278